MFLCFILSQLIYNYGFTALAVICGLIAGALIVILIIYIIYKKRRNRLFDSEEDQSSKAALISVSGYCACCAGSGIL